jgi:four helix bundle protein
MSNIAEGFDRGSNKEFIQYLTIARGSLSELKSLCYAAKDIDYIDDKKLLSLVERCLKLSGLINGFISYLKSSDRKW